MTGFLSMDKTQKKTLAGKNEDEVYGEHLGTVGEMIEELETKNRQYLDNIYLAKTKSIVFNCRVEGTVQMEDHKMKLANDLKNLKIKTLE